MYDPDEIEEEQRERDQRNKVCGWLAAGLWLKRAGDCSVLIGLTGQPLHAQLLEREHEHFKAGVVF